MPDATLGAPGARHQVIRAVDRLLVSKTFGMGYRSERLFIDALSYLDPVPRGLEVRTGSAAGRRSLLVVPEGADEDPRVVWMHGGAYCYNSPRAYATLVAHVPKAIGVSVLIPSYRLAPEHPYPAGHEDTLSTFRAIRDRGHEVIVAGDSAGGGLAIATSIALRDAGEAAPAGMLLMSPWWTSRCLASQSGSTMGRTRFCELRTLEACGVVRRRARPRRSAPVTYQRRPCRPAADADPVRRRGALLL